MRKHRRAMTVLGGGVIAAAMAAVVIILCTPRLPDPATADRDGLLRWLVTRDLDREPYETRLTLARRLEQEFGEEVDWAAVGRELDEQQRKRVWANVLSLLEPWLADRVDGYFQLQETERPAYVDRTLQLIDHWQEASALRDGGPSRDSSGSGPGLLVLFAQRLDRWMQSVTPQRRVQVREFLLALQSRWFKAALLGPAPARPL